MAECECGCGYRHYNETHAHTHTLQPFAETFLEYIFFSLGETMYNFPNESLIEFYSWGNFSPKLCRSEKFSIFATDSAFLPKK